MRPVKETKMFRLNFFMKQELVEDIDRYADSLGITRSAAISVLCANQLQQLEAMKNIGLMSNAVTDLKGIAENIRPE